MINDKKIFFLILGFYKNLNAWKAPRAKSRVALTNDISDLVSRFPFIFNELCLHGAQGGQFGVGFRRQVDIPEPTLGSLGVQPRHFEL